MKEVMIGIIGCGNMAVFHYNGFSQAGAKVTALADTNLNLAKQFASSRGITNVYANSTEMLKSHPEIDAVSIIVPNKFHYPLVMEALNAGKHVFCEKPPALNAKEMEEMRALSQKTGKILMFNFNNRARPESQAIFNYIKDGKVGKINSAQATWIRRAGIPGFGGWFTNKALSGGGPVVDLPHMMDLALYFMDYPEPAYILAAAFYDFMDNKAFKGKWNIPDTKGGITDVESSCHAMITFKSGQSLMIRSSWAELNERELISVVFQGTKAGAKMERYYDVDGVEETNHDSCRIFTEEYGNQVNRDIITDFDETMGRINNAVNFIESIRGNEKPFNTPEQALILMKIIDALYESANTKKPVAIQ
jgi:predicted dehydrogenase